MAGSAKLWPCNQKIADSLSEKGNFVTTFSREFNFLILKMAVIADNIGAWRAILGQNQIISMLYYSAFTI